MLNSCAEIVIEDIVLDVSETSMMWPIWRAISDSVFMVTFPNSYNLLYPCSPNHRYFMLLGSDFRLLKYTSQSDSFLATYQRRKRLFEETKQSPAQLPASNIEAMKRKHPRQYHDAMVWRRRIIPMLFIWFVDMMSIGRQHRGSWNKGGGKSISMITAHTSV